MGLFYFNNPMNNDHHHSKIFQHADKIFHRIVFHQFEFSVSICCMLIHGSRRSMDDLFLLAFSEVEFALSARRKMSAA